MGEQQALQDKLQHLIYCLNNCKSYGSSGKDADFFVDELEFWGHDARSDDYLIGFVRAMKRCFYNCCELDERLDKAFDAVIDF